MIRPRSRCAHSVARLHLEHLEDRLLLAANAVELPQVALVPDQYPTDHILVRFRDGVAPFALGGTQLGANYALVPQLYSVLLAADLSVPAAVAKYSQDARVQYAEADQVLTPAAVPNDPQFASQWDMRNTGQSGGKPGADVSATLVYGANINANKLPIALFDTGVDYTHPDLYLNIWVNQKEIPASRLANLIDVDGDGLITMRDLNDKRNQGVGKITDLNGNGYIDGGDLLKPMVKNANGSDTGLGGWADGVSEDGDTQHVDDIIGWNSNANNNNPMDGFGHGTHVAGTIGAVGNNGVGVAGIVWAAQLVPVKFFDDTGHGTISQFIDGLNWALAHGIKISNNSWNDSGYTPALEDAIKVAQGQGHLFVAAAGNNGRNTDTQPAYPADYKYDNVISVGATDRNDNLAGFSNYGTASVSIAAPGVDILSTNPGNQYGLRSGTSMATPHVTAVAALVWSLHPQWTYQQVIAQVLNTADRLPSLTGKVATGRLNAAAALGITASTPTPVVAPLHMVNSQASGTPGTFSKITVKFDRPPLVSTFTAADVRLTAPDGSLVAITGISPVPNTSGLVFDLTFSTQTRLGYYKLQVGPDVTDLGGNSMVVFNSSLYLAAASPSGTPGPALHVVDSQAGGAAGTISKITVKFDRPPLISTFSADDVRLTAPDGSLVAITSISPVPTNALLFDLNFAPQTTPGYYKLQVGPDVTDSAGNSMVVFNSSLYLQPAAPPANSSVQAASASLSAAATPAAPAAGGRLSAEQVADVLGAWLTQPSSVLQTGPLKKLVAGAPLFGQ